MYLIRIEKYYFLRFYILFVFSSITINLILHINA